MKLGISLYPEKEKETDIRTYLSLASLYRCGRVFTSMFSVSEDVDIVETIKILL